MNWINKTGDCTAKGGTRQCPATPAALWIEQKLEEVVFYHGGISCLLPTLQDPPQGLPVPISFPFSKIWNFKFLKILKFQNFSWALSLFPGGSKGWPVSHHSTHSDNSSLCTSWRTLAAPLSFCSLPDHSGTKYHLVITCISVLQPWGYPAPSWQCTRCPGEEIIRTSSFNSGEVNQRDQNDLYSHLQAALGWKCHEAFAGRSLNVH